MTAADALRSLCARVRRHIDTGDYAAGRDDAEALLTIGRDDPDAINLAAVILFRGGDRSRAIALLQDAAARMPADAALAGNLANALFESGAKRESLAWYEKAIALDPKNASYRLNHGLALQANGMKELAETAFRHSLRLDPSNDSARRALAGNLAEAGAIDDATELYRALQTTRRDDALAIRAATMLPPILPSLEAIATIRTEFTRALDGLTGRGLRIDSPSNVGSPCFFLAYHGENERDTQRRIADLFLEICPSLPYVAPHCANPDHRQADGRLRIGFLSANLREHTIGRLFGGLIAGFDPARFETILFRRPQTPDGMSQEIDRSVARVVPIPTDLVEAQRQIAACELDIMFYPDIGMDLATYGLAFARLAPVQCVSWGHPLTTGIPTIDYFLSWDLAEPAGADLHYTERLVRLRSLPVCYRRPQFDPERMHRSRFGLPEDRTLYLCLQTLFKFHPSFDPALGAVLRGDPNGTVVLIEGQRARWKEMLMARFRRTIPDVADRILFVPPQTNENYLALTALGDVILDPPVFGGGNTTLEALAAGRPVVTLPGDYLRSRLTQGFLRHIGCTAWIARDISEYSALAIEASRHRPESAIDPGATAMLFDQRATIDEHAAFLTAARAAARQGRRLPTWPA
jgi:predicted O-linked N-acetylglucosamine transferase (SPINDLY family)